MISIGAHGISPIWSAPGKAPTVGDALDRIRAANAARFLCETGFGIGIYLDPLYALGESKAHQPKASVVMLPPSGRIQRVQTESNGHTTT